MKKRIIFIITLVLFFVWVLSNWMKGFEDALIIIYAILFSFLNMDILSLKNTILLYIPMPFIILLLSWYTKSNFIMDIEKFLTFAITLLLGYEFYIKVFSIEFRKGDIEKIIFKKIIAIIIFAILIKIVNNISLLLF